MGVENGKILERDCDKGWVNEGFKLFENYGERDKERVES